MVEYCSSNHIRFTCPGSTIDTRTRPCMFLASPILSSIYISYGCCMYSSRLWFCLLHYHVERRGSVMVSMSAWHAAGRGFDSRTRHVSLFIRCKNLTLNIRDCLSRCLSEETLKAVGPFYLVSIPGEVKDPTQGVNGQIPCRGLHTSLNYSCVSPKMGCLEYT